MCINPIYLESRDYQPLPCGKCYECKKRTANGWAFRLMEEEKNSESSLFITLTYDTVYVPLSKRGRMSLSKRELQLFFKRLRKANTQGNALGDIKYFAVGEYGGKTVRPHYHIILFNAAVETIQDAWGMGHVYYGSVTGASVAYTLKYMLKHQRKWKDDRENEFRIMSKKLGISYVEKKNFSSGIKQIWKIECI